ncbi:hypothetical protein [Methylobacterium longum]|uniref:Uncharacterized protein n=1 Tax=Methylobacterium longum TaxID=767694 RepID=A0ABT8AXV4_9HYPH|nr:hypothetical protein [Methylobacterium longum]MDN3574653.1 hypothetical protein [Methylobacterium longum]GJE13660.1 hypothetical protein FOHLNKBM_4724 [Methylobacterium longum]
MRPFFAIAPYAVAPRGRAYAVWLGTELIEHGFDCEADAYGRAHDLLDADEDEAAAQAEFEAQRFLEAA